MQVVAIIVSGLKRRGRIAAVAQDKRQKYKDKSEKEVDYLDFWTIEPRMFLSSPDEQALFDNCVRIVYFCLLPFVLYLKSWQTSVWSVTCSDVSDKLIYSVYAALSGKF